MITARLCVIVGLVATHLLSTGVCVLPEPAFKHSVCYGSTFDNRMDSTCVDGPDPSSPSVIAMIGVSAGAKPTVLNCPLESSVDTNTSAACCVEDTDDCTFDVGQTDYHAMCSGKPTCTATLAQNFQITDKNCGADSAATYASVTNYLAMDYYCVQATRISQMCTTVAHTAAADAAVYVWSPGYPAATVPGPNCTCSLETDDCEARIQVFTVHVDLGANITDCQHTLEVIDGSGARLMSWTCDNNSNHYTITDTVAAATYIQLVFTTMAGTSAGNYFWIGFQSTSVTDGLHLRCPAEAQTTCLQTTTSTTTTPTTTSVTTTLPTTSTSATTTTQQTTSTTEATTTTQPTTSTTEATTTTQPTTSTTEATTTTQPTTSTTEATTTTQPTTSTTEATTTTQPITSTTEATTTSQPTTTTISTTPPPTTTTAIPTTTTPPTTTMTTSSRKTNEDTSVVYDRDDTNIIITISVCSAALIVTIPVVVYCCRKPRPVIDVEEPDKEDIGIRTTENYQKFCTVVKPPDIIWKAATDKVIDVEEPDKEDIGIRTTENYQKFCTVVKSPDIIRKAATDKGTDEEKKFSTDDKQPDKEDIEEKKFNIN